MISHFYKCLARYLVKMSTKFNWIFSHLETKVCSATYTWTPNELIGTSMSKLCPRHWAASMKLVEDSLKKVSPQHLVHFLIDRQRAVPHSIYSKSIRHTNLNPSKHSMASKFWFFVEQLRYVFPLKRNIKIEVPSVWADTVDEKSWLEK